MTLRKAFNEKERLLYMTEGGRMLGNWFSLMTKTNLKLKMSENLFSNVKKAVGCYLVYLVGRVWGLKGESLTWGHTVSKTNLNPGLLINPCSFSSSHCLYWDKDENNPQTWGPIEKYSGNEELPWVVEKCFLDKIKRWPRRGPLLKGFASWGAKS